MPDSRPVSPRPSATPEGAVTSAAPNRARRKRSGRPNYFWRRVAVVMVLAALLYGTGWSVWHLGRAMTAWFAPPVVASATEPAATDVLVVGGTPSGVAAALSAARHGARVVLISERPKLGGDIIYAYLNMFDVPLLGPHEDESPVAYGIFGQFFRQLGTAFDVDRAERWLEQSVAREPRIYLVSDARITRVLLRNGRLEGVRFNRRDGSAGQVMARATVDATNDAQVAARAGAGYTVGRERVNPDRKMQAAGLLFAVRGVNWKEVSAYVRDTKSVPLSRVRRWKKGVAKAVDVRVRGRRAIIRLGGVHGNYAWERGEIVKDYVARGPNIDVISINFGRQSDGTVILNTLNIVGVNGLDSASKTRAHREGSAEIPWLIRYLRRKMPGFKNAQLQSIAPELYIRETRHISGFATLDVENVRAGTPFPDRVALASYALDLHPYSKGDLNPFGPTRYLYCLPLRALVPRKVDGVFVASRSLSATYSAAGSARVIPITMAAGEASGAAAAQCAHNNFTPHDLVQSPEKIAALQKELRAAGMDIGDRLLEKNKG